MQLANELKSAAIAHANIDFEKMHEIAKHIHENPADLSKFTADPEGFAYSFNGFRPQPGHHLHIADGQNNLFPAEEEGVFGADERGAWGRTEIRVGYKTTALVECI